MAPHSSTLAWKIPWTEEPSGLQSMGSLRVGYNWSDLAAAAAWGDLGKEVAEAGLPQWQCQFSQVSFGLTAFPLWRDDSQIYLQSRLCSWTGLTPYCLLFISTEKSDARGFPGGSVAKNLSANAGDTCSIPDQGRSHMPWGTKPVCHNYWACALEPGSHNYWAHGS